jgi:hypothetical protein
MGKQTRMIENSPVGEFFISKDKYMNTTVLIEAIDLEEAIFDAQNHVLRNVGLLRAGKSLNNRVYSEELLQRDHKVFEGSRAFDSHKEGRGVGELTGYYKDVRYENGVVRADRYFIPTRAGQDVMAVVEAIKNGAPRTLAGLSINAVGTGKMQRENGENVLYVESLKKAKSVDDVVEPAGGGSYTESVNGDELALTLLQEMTFEEFFNARPDYIKRIQNEMKTVRQNDAIKAVKTEADSTLKALTEAQNELQSSQAKNEAALTELVTARRELAIEKALRAAGLPALYENDLRGRLSELPEAKWLEVISTEKKKAKRIAPTLPMVTGAGQQVSTPITMVTKRDPDTAMRERLAALQSPDELLRITG